MNVREQRSRMETGSSSTPAEQEQEQKHTCVCACAYAFGKISKSREKDKHVVGCCLGGGGAALTVGQESSTFTLFRSLIQKQRERERERFMSAEGGWQGSRQCRTRHVSGEQAAVVQRTPKSRACQGLGRRSQSSPGPYLLCCVCQRANWGCAAKVSTETTHDVATQDPGPRSTRTIVKHCVVCTAKVIERHQLIQSALCDQHDIVVLQVLGCDRGW